MKLKKKGFTLVELIIVIAIIAILAVTSFTVLTKWLNKARDSKRVDAVNTIYRQITYYISDTKHPDLENAFNSGQSCLQTYDTNWLSLTNWVKSWNYVKTFVFNECFAYTGLGLVDEMSSVPKDPYTGKPYVIWVAFSGTKYSGNKWRLFQVAATKEYDENDKPQANAYVIGNYKKWQLTGAWAGYESIVISYQYDEDGSSNMVVNKGTTNLPYKLK